MVGTAASWGRRAPHRIRQVPPHSGDCNCCHKPTTPTFGPTIQVTPSPRITFELTHRAPQCHTTVGNNALYAVTHSPGRDADVSSCHGSKVAGTFGHHDRHHPAITSLFGALIATARAGTPPSKCERRWLHSSGTAATSPRRRSRGRRPPTVAAVVPCTTCHQSAPYMGIWRAPRPRWATRLRSDPALLQGPSA